MTHAEMVAKTHAFVKEKFNDETTGHDYWHMYRVWQLAKHLAATEPQADLLTVELGALLHDVADWKFHDGDEEAGPRAVRQWLESLGDVPPVVIRHVEDIARHVSFKGAKVKSQLSTLEGYIVSDADKLDAMGAIGIGRAFTFGGAHGRPMHLPDFKVEYHTTFEAYKRRTDGPTTAHFYEKLLLLKDRMFTDAGKKLAHRRHTVLENFLQEFLAEWDGQR